MHLQPTHRRTIAALTAVAVLVSACTTMPSPPTPEVRAKLGQVAVVALPQPPEGEFHTFAKGRAVGTAKGALGGGLYGLAYAAGTGAGGGPYASAAMAIAALVFTVVGAGMGAIVGHETAVPAKTAQEIQSRIEAVLGSMRLSDGVAEALRARAIERPDVATRGFRQTAYASSYTALADQGVDTVLEISIPVAGFRGGEGKAPSIAFYMTARVRALRAGDNHEHYARDFLYSSPERSFGDWFADGAAPFAREFESATRALAERILDELFLVTAFPFPSGMWAPPGDPAFSTCWFRPIYPERQLRPLYDFMRHPQVLDPQRDMLLYPVVDSLRPTLEWEPLPRPRDRRPENQDVIAGLKDVQYDLKIWEANDGHPGRLVYDRPGLTESRHRLTYPLGPATRYFWTFRARYQLDGEPQATRWAFSLAPVNPPMPATGSCNLDVIPDPNYYRFATPASAG